MAVVATDLQTSEEAAANIDVELLHRADILCRTDFVTLHVPSIHSTRRLINARLLDGEGRRAHREHGTRRCH